MEEKKDVKKHHKKKKGTKGEHKKGKKAKKRGESKKIIEEPAAGNLSPSLEIVEPNPRSPSSSPNGEDTWLFLLPTELQVHILTYLSWVDVLIYSLVCKEFKQLCSDERLWKSLYIAQHSSGVKDMEVSWKNALINNSEMRGRDLASKFLVSAKEGYYYLVAQLLKKNSLRIDRNMGLHRAIQGGHLQIVELLVAEGADVNSIDHEKWTPLHCAARELKLGAMQYLLGHGGSQSVNAVEKWGYTPLHFVVQRARANHWGTVQEETVIAMLDLLIKAGADVNAADAEGKTPLHWAISMGASVDIIKSLLKAGANPSLQSRSGKSCVTLASQAKNEADISRLLGSRV